MYKISESTNALNLKFEVDQLSDAYLNVDLYISRNAVILGSTSIIYFKFGQLTFVNCQMSFTSLIKQRLVSLWPQLRVYFTDWRVCRIRLFRSVKYTPLI